jgi:hypothetical protein
MAKDDFKCPFAGKIKWHNKEWPMMECKAITEKDKANHITGCSTAMRSDHFHCVAKDWTQCISYQKMMGTYQGHNCFEHDYDGGVCLICGSCTHREELRSALGEDGWEDDRRFL